MESNIFPCKSKPSEVWGQIRLVQKLRESEYMNASGREKLSEELLTMKAITKSVLKNTTIYCGEIYPKKIPSVLYSFGDIFDHCILLSHKMVQKINRNKSISNSEREFWDVEMYAAMLKFTSIVYLSNGKIRTVCQKSSETRENANKQNMNNSAVGTSNRTLDTSHVTGTEFHGFKLFAFKNRKKTFDSKNAYMTHVNDDEYDADIDEDGDVCDTDSDTDTEVEEDMKEWLESSASDNSSHLKYPSWSLEEGLSDEFEDFDCETSSSAFWNSEWMTDLIKEGYKKIRKQRKMSFHSKHASSNGIYDNEAVKEDNSVLPNMMPDLKNASNFERFVILEFPSMPSDYEPLYDEEESRRLWDTAVEEEKLKYSKDVSSTNKDSEEGSSAAKASVMNKTTKQKRCLNKSVSPAEKKVHINVKKRKYIPKHMFNLIGRKKRFMSHNIKRMQTGKGYRYVVLKGKGYRYGKSSISVIKKKSAEAKVNN